MATPLSDLPGRWIRSSLTVKVFFTGFLVLLLLIPASMIKGVIRERAQTLSEAQKEVGEKWGQAQTVGGPVLIVPYKHFGNKSYAYFLPNTLSIQGSADPEVRYRGGFETILYTANLKLTGSFAAPDFSTLAVDLDCSGIVLKKGQKPEQVCPKAVLWNETVVQIGLTDLRGLQENPIAQWNDARLDFKSTSGKKAYNFGLSAAVQGLNPKNASHAFSINLKANGSRSLQFLPVGSQTTVELTSAWPSPSFNGAFLPTTHTINEKGFSSQWKVLDLNRSFPQFWTEDPNNYDSNRDQAFFELNPYSPSSYSAKDSFGLDFILPVDVYQKSERSVKYAGLFIVLTFLTFFLLEVFLKIRIHPIQYLLVGFALVLFYLLLLSLSEQLPFGLAYLIGSLATVGLVSSYSAAILRKRNMALLLIGILSSLYVYLYVLLQREDYSLLMGSIGLFLILSLVMFLTRKIDWYQAPMADNRS